MLRFDELYCNALEVLTLDNDRDLHPAVRALEYVLLLREYHRIRMKLRVINRLLFQGKNYRPVMKMI